MISLTTRQRDILKVIIDFNRPISSVEMARMLRLTPRQVNYSIRGVKVWLQEHNQDLGILPGVGFTVSIQSDAARSLSQEISTHSGVQIILCVSQRQQLLAEVLWSETPFSSEPVFEITHAEGLIFNLQGDATLLPLVGHANQLLSNIHMRRTIGLVAKSEELLGGRFTDDAVLHLALVFAIMANRVASGYQ